MSVNRITSSLACRESGLKLITHAWRSGRMGGGEDEKDKTEPGVFLVVGTPSSTHWEL